jgi:hypothetical protein
MGEGHGAERVQGDDAGAAAGRAWRRSGRRVKRVCARGAGARWLRVRLVLGTGRAYDGASQPAGPACSTAGAKPLARRLQDFVQGLVGHPFSNERGTPDIVVVVSEQANARSLRLGCLMRRKRAGSKHLRRGVHGK